MFIGILPGAGGDIASWVGLNIAKSQSKHPELFGTGIVEGVAAPESANNAVTGGALIPLLTLGIPGSSTAAVLMGGLTIHGLAPGFELFSKYADITYCVILGFLAANILMGLVGWAAGRYLTMVSKVPIPLLIPCIAVTDPGGDIAARAGQDTDEHADDGAFKDQRDQMDKTFWQYIPTRPLSIFFIILIVLALFAPLVSKAISKSYEKKHGHIDAAEDI